MPSAPALEVDVALSVGADAHQRDLKARFTLPDGILVIFGPSGSGKTLTIRAIAGLLRPRAGAIRLRGDPIFDAAQGIHLPPEERQLGYVPQHATLFPHLTARDNVAYGLKARGNKNGLARRVAEQWLVRLGVERLADRFPRQLSGGEAQRVALARALAPEPRLLLLDEPFANLDMATRREMRRVVKGLQEGSGVPMVFVTHSPGEAIEMGHRLVRYGPAGSAEEGRPDELVEREE